MSRNRPETQPGAVSPRRTLFIAAALGVAAAVLNVMYLYDSQSEELTVYKAARIIKAGEPLDEGSFEKVRLLGNVGQVRSVVVDADSFAAFAQQPLGETLKPGDLLLTRSFIVGGQSGMSDSIGANQRAVALRVADEAQTVAYFVRPGDMVDIWGASGAAAFPIAKNACVKAIGDAYLVPQESGHDGRYRSVTIFVPSDEAKVQDMLANVALADNKLSLTLVGGCKEGQTVLNAKFEPKGEELGKHLQGEEGAPEDEP
jgi:Flp pilus assembly protein CpaB